jgi:hypothetical protein
MFVSFPEHASPGPGVVTNVEYHEITPDRAWSRGWVAPSIRSYALPSITVSFPPRTSNINSSLNVYRPLLRESLEKSSTLCTHLESYFILLAVEYSIDDITIPGSWPPVT